MLNYTHFKNNILSLLILLFLVSVANGGTVIYSGSFSATDITWEYSENGVCFPQYQDLSVLQDTGKPVLPVNYHNLLIPAGSNNSHLQLVPLKTRIIELPAELSLALPEVDSQGVSVDYNYLQSSENRFPANWNSKSNVSVYKGCSLASMSSYPIRAVIDENGNYVALELLEQYEIILVEGEVNIQDFVATRQRAVPGEKQKIEAALARMVDNPEMISAYMRDEGTQISPVESGHNPERVPGLDGSPVSYLIITNNELEATFQQLADYRTSIGMPAAVRTIEWIESNCRNGADVQETIRFFISDAYEQWGLEYVVIGGDTDVVPARYIKDYLYGAAGYTVIPADLYFACLDGNWNGDGDDTYGEVSITYGDDLCDMASEVALGRIPVSTVHETQDYIAKVILYEGQPAGADWTNGFLAAAEVLFWIDDETPSTDGASFAQDLIDDFVVPCTDMSVTRYYENYTAYPGSLDETKPAVISAINSNQYGIMSQIGHGFFFDMSLGSGVFTVSDADALENHDHPFLLYALNCASAAFDYSCLMERLVLHPTGGTIASIGSSRAAFPYTSNNYQQEFFSLLLCEGVSILGDTVELSRLPFIGDVDHPSFNRWTYMNYTLLGDPGLSIWTSEVRDMSVSLDPALEVGNQTVTAYVESDMLPVPGATVTLSMGDDVYVTGISDINGEVDFDITLVEAGVVSLSARTPNKEVCQEDIAVNNSGAYLTVSSFQIIDDGTNGSTGNANGVIEAGETVAIRPTVTDTGSGGAGNVTGSLSVDNPEISVLVSSSVIGNVPSGGSVQAATSFLILVDPDFGDGSTFEAQFSISGTRDIWLTENLISVAAPELETVKLVWSDVEFGDGDGVLDNNELVTIVPSIKNFGSGTSDYTFAQLFSDSPTVTIGDNTSNCGSLELLQIGELVTPFTLQVSDVLLPYQCYIVFTDTYGRNFTHYFSLDPPSAPIDIVADSSMGADIIALSWAPNSEEDLYGYNVYRSPSFMGAFEKINQDIIVGTSYFRDAGLELLTRYYYVISAVDSSLVESVMSIQVGQSTAPPESGDFPLPISVETSGHFAVGDVNGDGTLEIVLGADEVYVWDALGNELIDGDGNAQTLGPITDIDGTFSPSGLALYDLDGIPGMEIIATEIDAELIHIFRWDGTELDGWPQSCGLKWNWATPAVGDVDGDGDPEIVVNNLRGQTMVWHADGTELLDGDANPVTNGVFFVRPNANYEWGVSSPALYDLDGDGADEIIFGTKYGWNHQNYLHALKFDQSEAAGFPFAVGNGGSIVNSPAIGDFDNNGDFEITFISEDDMLHAIHHDGSVVDGFPVVDFISSSANVGIPCPSPALGDFNGDGSLEIVAIEVVNVNESHIHVVYASDIGGFTPGTDIPGYPIYIPGNSESSPVVGDINGDELLDVVFGIGGGSEDSPNNIYAFSTTGASIDGFPITLGGPVRPAPVICDLDNDLDVDIIYGGWDLLIHVWDMPFPYNQVNVPWPTFACNSARTGVYDPDDLSAVPDLETPSLFTVLPVYPNPFNPATNIRLYVPEGTSSPVDVSVFDVQGRRVRQLHAGQVPAGWNQWTWYGLNDSGRNVSSGTYFLRALWGNENSVQKMTLVK
ncbi:MAG: T9SS type A sorting domain-containing protein [bacterium]|nr:T9SS type A sorting domain-containing protein [bacterium]